MKTIITLIIGSILLASCQKQEIKPIDSNEKYYIQVIMVDDTGQRIDSSLVISSN